MVTSVQDIRNLVMDYENNKVPDVKVAYDRKEIGRYEEAGWGLEKRIRELVSELTDEIMGDIRAETTDDEAEEIPVSEQTTILNLTGNYIVQRDESAREIFIVKKPDGSIMEDLNGYICVKRWLDSISGEDVSFQISDSYRMVGNVYERTDGNGEKDRFKVISIVRDPEAGEDFAVCEHNHGTRDEERWGVPGGPELYVTDQISVSLLLDQLQKPDGPGCVRLILEEEIS